MEESGLMRITATITDGQNEITKHILEEFAKVLNRAMVGAATAIRRKVEEEIVRYIQASPEYASLLNGDLRKELGLVNSDRALQSIINTIISNMQIDYTPIRVQGNSIDGGITVSILQADYRDVLSLSESSYMSKSGITVPWLDWLLTSGTAPVVIGYTIKYNPNDPKSSRTGPVMVKSKSSWSIPTEYAGTTGDNFLTRALLPIENDLIEIISKEIQNRLI
jgi:hypothetical protein